MADTQEAVRRLSIQATTVGVTDATKQLNDLAKAQGGVAVASANTEKATLSLDQKFASIERRYVAGVRAQQDYEKIQRQVNAAVSQNPALQERANAILASAKERHDQLTGSQRAMATVMSDVNSRLQASAGSFGIVGQTLTALGPLGLASAASIGLAAAALYKMSEGAHELAQKARELKDFSESTGLTVAQVQALRSEATKFGVDSETLQAGLQKFTTGFQDLRLGTGDLLTQVRRINPALADQMALATDTATAFTLYARAVAQTTNIFERNALARAGLGKGGPTVAEFLGKVGDVKALTDAYEAAGRGLQKNAIDKLSDLDLQITKTTSKARENFQSIFAEPVLNAELQLAKVFLQISETAKNFTMSDDLKRYLAGVGRGLLGAVPVVGPAISAAQGIASLAGSGKPSMRDFQSPSNSYTTFQGAGSAASAAAAGGGETIESVAAKWKNYVAVLGSAATPTERLNSAIADLNVKAKEAGLGADVLGRGIAALRLDDAIARLSARNSALGELASVTDIVKLKTLELVKAQQQGADLTKEQIAQIKLITQAQAEWARVTAQAQVGVFDMAKATKAASDEFQTWIDKEYFDPSNPEQYAAALNAMNAKLRATADAAKVAGSALPQLTQMGLDAANVTKQLDTFGVSTLNSLSDSLVSITNGSAPAGAAFANFGNQVVTALEKMIIQLLIIKPLAESLQGFFGSFSFGPTSVGGPNGPTPLASAHGNVFSGGNVVPFARGGVIGGPAMAPMALMGEAGPEAVVPLRRGPDGNLGVASAGGGNNVQVNVINQAHGTQVSTNKRRENGVDIHDIIIGSVRKGAASGDLDSALGVRFGSRPRAVSR